MTLVRALRPSRRGPRAISGGVICLVAFACGYGSARVAELAHGGPSRFVGPLPDRAFGDADSAVWWSRDASGPVATRATLLEMKRRVYAQRSDGRTQWVDPIGWQVEGRYVRTDRFRNASDDLPLPGLFRAVPPADGAGRSRERPLSPPPPPDTSASPAPVPQASPTPPTPGSPTTTCGGGKCG